MVNIITIEREYGCGGGDIAQLVANRLGWKLWDQRLTEEIARLANCPKAVVEAREERNDPLYYRLFKSFLRGSYEGSINAPKLNLVDSETILKSVAKTGRLLIVDEEYGPCSMASEIAARVADAGFDDLDAPIKRLNGAFAPTPYSPPLEAVVAPQIEDIHRAIVELIHE